MIPMAFQSSQWQLNTLFTTPTTDEMILAQGCVALISTLSIFLILLWSITSFRHDYTLTATKPMRYTCIISMLFFFIQSLLQLTGINNAFVDISKTSCQIFYPSQLIAYNFAKIAMFWLFSYRLQLLCNSNNKLRISPVLLNLYRTSCLIIPTLLWIAWIYFTFPDTKPHDTVTKNNKYQDCFPETFPHAFIAENIVGGGVVLADVIFSLSALIAFIIKCYQITQLITIKKQGGKKRKRNTLQSINVYHHLHNSPSMRMSLTPHSLSPKSDLNATNGNNQNGNNDMMMNGTNQTTEDKKVIHARLMKKLENMACVIKKSTFLTTIAMFSTMFYTVGGAYILRQIGFFLCFDGVIGSLCMACLFRFGDDLYDFLFSRMEKILFWLFYVCSCCCCICCKFCDWKDDNNDDEYTYSILSPEEDKRSIIYNAEHITGLMGNNSNLGNLIRKVETNINVEQMNNRSLSMNDTDSKKRAEVNGCMQASISSLHTSGQTNRTDKTDITDTTVN